jgi:hypothetical protein
MKDPSRNGAGEEQYDERDEKLGNRSPARMKQHTKRLSERENEGKHGNNSDKPKKSREKSQIENQNRTDGQNVSKET